MSTENLNHEEGIKKLKQLAEDAGICMFCTDLNHHPIAARPMSLREVDAEGNLWFISSLQSNKNFEIKEDKRVQLFFQNKSDQEYLSIYGEAYVYTDKSTIEDKWVKTAGIWFEEGKDDPNVSIIRVQPSDSYYWDTKAGKIVSFITFAAAAVTGKTTDNSDGVEGKLNI